MNKKVILSISLVVLIGWGVLVFAQEPRAAVQLNKGWNIVAGFTSVGQIYGDDLRAKNIKAIYAYIAPAQQYIRLHPQPEIEKLGVLRSTYKFDDDIIAQSSVWVYSDKDGILGYNFDLPLSSEKLPLYKGWNFVPLTQEVVQSPQQSDLTLEDIKGSCKIEKVYLWQNKWVNFMTITPKNPPEMSHSLLGKSFIIKVSNNCKLGEKTQQNIGSPPVMPN